MTIIRRMCEVTSIQLGVEKRKFTGGLIGDRNSI